METTGIELISFTRRPSNQEPTAVDQPRSDPPVAVQSNQGQGLDRSKTLKRILGVLLVSGLILTRCGAKALASVSVYVATMARSEAIRRRRPCGPALSPLRQLTCRRGQPRLQTCQLQRYRRQTLPPLRQTRSQAGP